MNFCAFLPFHLLFYHLFKLILFLKLCLTSPDFLFSSLDSPVCFLLLPSSCRSFSLLSCLPYSISNLLSRPLKLFDFSPLLFFHSLIFSHHPPSFCFHHSPPCLSFSLLSACFSSSSFFNFTPSVSFKLLFPRLSFCHPFSHTLLFHLPLSFISYTYLFSSPLSLFLCSISSSLLSPILMSFL